MDFRLFFIPLLTLFLFTAHLWWYLAPEHVGWLLAGLGVVHLLAAFWLNPTRKDWWGFAIAPAILNWGALVYALITSQPAVMITVLVVSFLSALLYWRLVFLYTFQHTSYRPFSLERFATYLNFLSLFFAAAALYGLETFLDLRTWQLAAIFFLIISAVVGQWIWAQKIEWHQGWRYGSAIALCLLELFFIIILLPLDYNVGGFLVASAWHLLSFFSAEHLAGRLNPTRARLVAGVVAGAWLVVLLTARWF